MARDRHFSPVDGVSPGRLSICEAILQVAVIKMAELCSQPKVAPKDCLSINYPTSTRTI